MRMDFPQLFHARCADMTVRPKSADIFFREAEIRFTGDTQHELPVFELAVTDHSSNMNGEKTFGPKGLPRAGHSHFLLGYKAVKVLSGFFIWHDNL